MATIIYNAENIADDYAPSLNAAFAEIFAASGVRPRVVAPYGAWSSPAIDKAYGIKGRGPASDHYKGRAVDITNWEAITNRIGSRFKSILGKHGWYNIQVNGDPFGSEPWHYASHKPLSTSGSGVTPLAPERRKKPMASLYYSDELGSKRVFAFAGDSPGTPANWIETNDPNLANQYSALISADAIKLDAGTFALFKGWYLAPLSTAGGSSGGGGTFVLDDDTIAKLAQANAQFFFAEQKKPGN